MTKSMLATLLVILLAQEATFATTTITFDEFPADNNSGAFPANRYAYLGVTFTGTEEGATWGGNSNGDPGNWDLEGTNGPIFSGFNGDSYAMTLTHGNAFSFFSLDVSRSNGSSSNDTFTLEAYLNSALVETTTVPLLTINDWTTVGFTARADEIRWFGSGRGFHPFGIDNLNFDLVPEPSSIALGMVAALCLSLRLNRRRAS